jgi:hypothetical protein
MHFAFNFSSSTEETQTTKQLKSSKLSNSTYSESSTYGKSDANNRIAINPNVDKPDNREQSATRLNFVPLLVKDTESTSISSKEGEISVLFDVIPLRSSEKIKSAAQTEGILLQTCDVPSVLRRVRPLDPTRLVTLAGDSIQKSDLIPGIYEGGLKTWECSIDLCRYLYELYSTPSVENHSSDGITLALGSDGTTLELGCGHGLPGILVSLLGASRRNKVLFSDYNDYVLKYCTLRNIYLNTPLQFHEDLPSRIALVSGDWLQLSNLLSPVHGNNSKSTTQHKDLDKFISSSSSTDFSRFDLILAAETTYAESSARDTATLISRHLKFDTGVALVATKRYYFGVGGGSDCFRRCAELIQVERCELDNNQNVSTVYILQVKTVKVIDDGNIREILQIKLEKISK